MATSLKPSMQSGLEVGNGGSAEEEQKRLPYLDANESADGIREEQPEPPVPDCQSMKSDKSMRLPLDFNGVCPTYDSRSQSLETNSSVCSSDGGEMNSQGSVVTHQRRKCDICVGRIHKAVKFCKVCKAVYCEDHIRDHYMAPGLRKHTVVDATDDHGHVEIERTSTQVGLWKKNVVLFCILILILLGLVGGLWYHMSPRVEGKGRLDMRIVLLGKTGSGKSSTGNTILGREAFRAEASPVSVTTQYEKHNVVIGQNIITVIDTPGILGTLLQPEEVMVKTAECINTTPHIFLLVIRLEEFTDEDRKSVQWIQENFGEEALKYTIVLFTGVDQLEGKSVETFIKASSHLQQVINSCGDRYHVFNNKDKNDNTQVSELLEKIDELLNEYRGYHHVADLLIQERVRKEEMRERAQILQEEGIKREAAEREIREEEEKKREAAEREIREEEEKKREAAEREIREEEEKKREAAEREIREEEEKKREAAEREISEEEEKKREAAEREIREEEDKKKEAAEREIREEEEKKREAAEREIREEEEKKRKELKNLALKASEKSDIKFQLIIIVATIITLIIISCCKSIVDRTKEEHMISIQKEQKLENEIRHIIKEKYEKKIRLLKEALNRTKEIKVKEKKEDVRSSCKCS